MDYNDDLRLFKKNSLNSLSMTIDQIIILPKHMNLKGIWILSSLKSTTAIIIIEPKMCCI